MPAFLRRKIPCVYMLASRPNGILYTGVTSNLPLRVATHRLDLVDGFTSRLGVHQLVYYEMLESMEKAIRREKQLKNWRRAWKVRLIHQMNPEWQDLYEGESGAILDGPADRQRNPGGFR